MKIAKRIIFVLLYSNGNFFLSRNFNLQKVGNLEWLKKNFQFLKFIFSIDEIIVCEVGREKKNISSLASIVRQLSENCFIPITAGGGIKSISDAKLLFRSGSDKILFNSSLETNSRLIKQISNIYGAQSIVASIDVKKEKQNFNVYFNNGKINSKQGLISYFEKIQNYDVGEIMINSIDRDGTGFGVDFEIISSLKKIFKPLIVSGGLGKKEHFFECLKRNDIDAVATSNILNFLGTGLQDVRNYMLFKKQNLAIWKKKI